MWSNVVLVEEAKVFYLELRDAQSCAAKKVPISSDF